MMYKYIFVLRGQKPIRKKSIFHDHFVKLKIKIQINKSVTLRGKTSFKLSIPQIRMSNPEFYIMH